MFNTIILIGKSLIQIKKKTRTKKGKRIKKKKKIKTEIRNGTKRKTEIGTNLEASVSRSDMAKLDDRGRQKKKLVRP